MKIYAMSKSKQDIAADIESGTQLLILHLIKLWLYPNKQDKNHWRKEVAAKLNHVDSFKGSHRLPSAKFILQHSWYVHKSRLPKYVEIIQDDYGDMLDIDLEIHMLDVSIDAYFNWLANNLADVGIVSYKSIYRKLEELGF